MQKISLKNFSKNYSKKFDLYQLVKSSYLFSQLDKPSIEKIIQFFNVIILEADEILFNQGDKSEHLYILVNGQLVANMLTEKTNVVVGKIYIGETVGELGVFNKRPRTLTIKALNACILLELSRTDFLTIWKDYISAEAHIQVIGSIINRSQNIIKLLSNENIFQHSALIVEKNEISRHFVQNLKRFQTNKNIFIVDALYENPHRLTKDDIHNILHEAETDRTTLIFIIDSQHIFSNDDKKISISVNFLLENINGLFVSNHNINVIKKYEFIFNKNYYPHIREKGLIFLYQSNETPNNTRNFIQYNLFNCHYHIKIDSQKDIKRLIRSLSGKAYGLVCSGGGSKGWASIGVIKALQEAHLPIDAVGGTSSGSIVSAVFALTQDYETLLEVSKEIFTLGYSDISLRNLSFPLVSITNGRILTESLKNIFHQLHTEDLWLPNFSISCNLNTGEEVLQNTGLVWENLRASCSLPLIYPPVTRDGEIYLDGGLLNNFPVDHMRQMIGKNSFIVGVNLSSMRKDPLHYSIPHIMPFYTSLLTRFNLGYKNIKYPPLLSTFLNSLLIGSSARITKNALDTNLLIEPELSQYPMLGLHPKKVHQLIDIGYRACLEKLEKIGSGIGPQE